jgi:DNA-binding NtrC family response regulator
LTEDILHYYKYKDAQTKKIMEGYYLDGRILAATNKDLAREVNKGTFREDLFYRLSVAVIEVPPLRNRPQDISELISYFLSQISIDLNVSSKVAKLDLIERLERAYLKELISSYGRNISKTARQAKLDCVHLYKLHQKYKYNLLNES